MQKVEVDVFSDAVNIAVLRFPGRRWPGSLIQGDSLMNLVGMASAVCEKLQGHSDDELVAEAEDLRDHLQMRLGHYREVVGDWRPPS